MKIKLSILLVITVSLFINGCKKGDGDSFISLKSRKARLSGEWTIESWNFNLVSNVKNSNSYTTTYTLFGTTTTSTSNSDYTRTENLDLKIDNNNFSIVNKLTSHDQSNSSGSTNIYDENTFKSATVAGTATIEFEKDGSFSRTIQYSNANFNINSSASSSFGGSTSVVYNSTESNTEIIKGTWEFLGGIDGDYKNKERIILHVKSKSIVKTYSDSNGLQTNSTDSFNYEDGDNNEIWLLTTLKKDELVFEAETSFNVTNSTSEVNNSTLSGGTYTSNKLTTYTSTGVGSFNGSLTK